MSKRKLVWVDRDLYTYHLLEILSDVSSVDCKGFVNGKPASEYLKENHDVSLVISDYQLGDMSAFDLFHCISHGETLTNFILFSTHQPSEIQGYTLLNNFHYVNKLSFDPNDFTALIEQLSLTGDELSDVGSKLSLLREGIGLTPLRMAALLGVSSETLLDYEGLTSSVSSGEIVKLCRQLEFPMRAFSSSLEEFNLVLSSYLTQREIRFAKYN